jgi:hypothetical protein
MSYATALYVAILFVMLARFVGTMTIIVLLALIVLPQVNARPQIAVTIDRAPPSSPVPSSPVPSSDQRMTTKEPMHDALARWHSRPLLLINYLDMDLIQVQGLPKCGSESNSDCIEVPDYPWTWYKSPQS